MQIVTSPSAMQRQAGKWRRAGVRVGFVPTMGYLHAGHISLVQRARKLVGPRGVVVVSIYVNPTQFGPKEDLSRYPRDFARDKKLCREAGVNVDFCAGRFCDVLSKRAAGVYSYYVVEESLSNGMEGGSRPGQFRGVTTIVAKLFNLVKPDVAVFGAKDFQQAAVIRRMAQDLNFPLKIVVAPTYREPDGLAMSSRNKYLEGDLRPQAVVLWRAIQRAKAAVRKTTRLVSAKKLKTDLQRLIKEQPDARLDYVEFFDPATCFPWRPFHGARARRWRCSSARPG